MRGWREAPVFREHSSLQSMIRKDWTLIGTFEPEANGAGHTKARRKTAQEGGAPGTEGEGLTSASTAASANLGDWRSRAEWNWGSVPRSPLRKGSMDLRRGYQLPFRKMGVALKGSRQGRGKV